ncbi:NADPH:quinone oxidoreductase family protein [Amorphus sp. 3PC139-8]|uniref:NADPH:quinone oxidoreductase family protein n=1 Tax=Amorphus sp. 3PC139-8 TaxID=2735676 RepID=UPI00345D3F71
MKAVLVEDFGPVGTAKVKDVPDPVPGPGEILLRVEAVAANFVDILVLEGKYQFLPERPFVPGKGPVGTVEAVGEGVTSLKVGDRVTAMEEHGGYAQFAKAKADQCYLLPEGMTFVEAAGMALSFDTAWFALEERGRMKPGETVLVLGASGAVGSAAVQLAKAKGARVIAGASSERSAQKALDAGADHWVDLSRDNLRDTLREQVYALTDGRGVDIVLDPLGGDIFDAAIRTLAWRGRLVVIGFAAGRIPEVKVNYLMLKNIEVSGLQISDYRKRMPEMVRQCFDDVFGLYRAGKLKAPPVVRFPLEGYDRALNGLTNRSLDGRAIIEPWSAS